MIQVARRRTPAAFELRTLEGEGRKHRSARGRIEVFFRRRVGEVDLIHVSGVSALLPTESKRLSLTGIAAASGTNTDSRSSEETPPERYEESAKAEQPRPITTVRKTHSSFVEHNLPKRKPERVEVGSVFSPAPPWTCSADEGLSRAGRVCCGGKVARAEGVVDDGAATSTDALPEPTPARSSLSTDALPEPTPARSSSSTSVPSSAANPLGSTRPIGARFLVAFLERSSRLDSPLRSICGKGVFHSSMPCA